MEKKTLTLKRITAEQFQNWFVLDSPGYFIARQAMKAGELKTPLDALEALCLANQLYDSELLNRLLVELAPFGKAEEYAEKRGTDAGTDLVVQCLGPDRMKVVLREVMDEVRRVAFTPSADHDAPAEEPPREFDFPPRGKL
jgi:hypothetical protein